MKNLALILSLLLISASCDKNANPTNANNSPKTRIKFAVAKNTNSIDSAFYTYSNSGILLKTNTKTYVENKLVSDVMDTLIYNNNLLTNVLFKDIKNNSNFISKRKIVYSGDQVISINDFLNDSTEYKRIDIKYENGLISEINFFKLGKAQKSYKNFVWKDGNPVSYYIIDNKMSAIINYEYDNKNNIYRNYPSISSLEAYLFSLAKNNFTNIKMILQNQETKNILINYTYNENNEVIYYSRDSSYFWFNWEDIN